MLFIPVKTPYLFQWLFPNYTWKKPLKDKVIYLTFDDGPTPEITNWVLNQLEQHNAKATFFCIGNNIEKHPHIFKTIKEKGHLVANHTFNHVKGWQTSKDNYIKEIEKTQTVIDSFLTEKEINSSDRKSKLFRPPFGRIKNSQGKDLISKGYEIIMWSVLTFDWEQNCTPNKCFKNSLKASSGDIVVFHDSVKASENLIHTLPLFLKHYSDKGYVFKTL